MNQSIALALICATSLGAQTVPFVTPEPLATIQIVGVGAMRDALASTNVGRLAQDPKIRGFYAQFFGLAKSSIRMAEDAVDADLEELVELLLDYRGRITITVDATGPRLAGMDPDAIGLAFVMAPDQGTDLARIAKICRDASAAMPTSGTREIRVDGVALQCNQDGGGDGITVPRIVDGHLVMFSGTQLERMLDLFFQHRAGNELEWQAHDALVRARISGARGIDLLRGAVGTGEAEFADLVKVLGLDQIESVEMSLAKRGEDVIFDSGATFERDQPSGYLGAFVSTEPHDGTLSPAILQDAEFWAMQTVRLRSLYEVFREIATPFDDDFDGTFTEQTGLDFEKDVLQPFGERFFIVADAAKLVASAVADDDEPAGLVIGFEVDDPVRALAMIRKSAAHDESELREIERAGHTILVRDGEMHIAVERDCLFFVFGEATLPLLDRVLTHARESEAQRPSEPGVARRLRRAPPGWDSLAAVHLPRFARAVLDAVPADDLPRQADQIIRLVIGALAKYDLEHMIFVSGFAQRQYVQRWVW